MPAQASGTVTPAVIGTEETVSTVSVEGVYVLSVDTVNMVNGDEVVFNIYTKTLTGSVSALAYTATYKHAQGVPVKLSIPVKSNFEYVFKINQTVGAAARAFPWSIDAL